MTATRKPDAMIQQNAPRSIWSTLSTGDRIVVVGWMIVCLVIAILPALPHP